MKFPPPIRFIVPAILVLFLSGFLGLRYQLLQEGEAEIARKEVTDVAVHHAARLAGLIKATKKGAETEHLNRELSYHDEDPESKFAIQVDANAQIITASHRIWEGRSLNSTPAKDAQSILDLVFKLGTPQTLTLSDQDVVMAAYPISDSENGHPQTVAVVARDLSNHLGEARNNALHHFASTALVLLPSTFLLGLALQSLLTNRIQKLALSAASVLEGKAPIKSFFGNDELAKIDTALFEADQRARSQKRSYEVLFQRYNHMVETLPAMVIVSRNQRIEFINQRGLEVLGASTASEVLNRSPYDFLHQDYHAKSRETAELLRNGLATHVPVECRVVRIDGVIVDLEGVTSIYEDESGQVIQSVLTDVSERKASEAKREALSRDLQEKNKELEAIVYVASHDLRSPLVNVMGFSRQLAGACNQLEGIIKDAPEASVKAIDLEPIVHTTIPRALRFIEQGVIKMDALLAGFLRFSRIGGASMEIQRIDMNTLLKSVVGSLTYQIQQTHTDVRIGSLPGCEADPIQMNQVFTNLIDNAIKYRHPDRHCVISVQGHADENHLTYTVTDNGIGIANAHADKIFEIFHRLDPSASSGEGLGLTIAQRILKRHNGFISVESQSGEGSSFTVSLPVTSTPIRTAE
jgi:PAS domain S-box-containing protein